MRRMSISKEELDNASRLAFEGTASTSVEIQNIKHQFTDDKYINTDTRKSNKHLAQLKALLDSRSKEHLLTVAKQLPDSLLPSVKTHRAEIFTQALQQTNDKTLNSETITKVFKAATEEFNTIIKRLVEQTEQEQQLQ